MTDAANGVPGSSFLASLQAFEGRPAGPFVQAPDEVNIAMIRHWVEAMGDFNPVYVDDDAAKAAGFDGIIAPPTMLQAWIMRGLRASLERMLAAAPRGDRPDGSLDDMDRLTRLLDGAGFTSVVATNCEQTYERPLYLGDRLNASSVIETVSPEKHTALGVGHFVTTRTDFSDAVGERVGTMRFRILKFRPLGQSAQRPSKGRRPRPVITEDISFFFEGAKKHRLLIQRCVRCGRLRHPPLPACPSCRSFEWDAVEASGRGIIFSFVVVHHPQVEGFEYPLTIGLIELEEGTRLVADVVGIDPSDVAVGMEVEVGFEDVDDDLSLPFFRPRGMA